jgi:hypothetical protein
MPTACVCTQWGKEVKKPNATGIHGFPNADLDDSMDGLCSFACNYGNCSSFSQWCSTTQYTLPVNNYSLFDPPYCQFGVANADNQELSDLCSFACTYGFCPRAVCECDGWGYLKLLDPITKSNATSLAGNDAGLCAWACSRNYCPSEICYDPGTNLNDTDYGPYYNATEEEYYDFFDPGGMSCEPSLAPTTLDDLVNAVNANSVPILCWNQWALQILFNSLKDIQPEYQSAADGYDDLFTAYQGWVIAKIPDQLEAFMYEYNGAGNAYFDCVLKVEGRTLSGACDTLDLQDQIGGESGNWEIDYTLRDSNGFYAALLNQTGIEQDWVTFGTSIVTGECTTDGGGDHVGVGTRPCGRITHKKVNVPQAASSISVANPKTIVQAALANMTVLQNTLVGAYATLSTQLNEADGGDMITAASMPVFMVQSALDSMNTIKTIGSEVIWENKKNKILEILSIVLMVIPFVGEAGGELFGGVAMIARIAALIDELGNAALTAYNVVQDPLSAPFEVLSLLVGGLATGAKSEKDAFTEAADARKGMSATDLGLMGDNFAAKDSKVQKIVNACIKP